MADKMLPTDIDYVVVGGGLAGLVVANRLSEDASKKVLVIEAGANRKGDPKIDTPGLMTTLYDDPEYDWMFMTVPQVSYARLPTCITRPLTSKTGTCQQPSNRLPARQGSRRLISHQLLGVVIPVQSEL